MKVSVLQFVCRFSLCTALLYRCVYRVHKHMHIETNVLFFFFFSILFCSVHVSHMFHLVWCVCVYWCMHRTSFAVLHLCSVFRGQFDVLLKPVLIFIFFSLNFSLFNALWIGSSYSSAYISCQQYIRIVVWEHWNAFYLLSVVQTYSDAA